MKRNICFVMPNMSGGGAQRVISILASGFCDKGHNVSILLTSKNLIEYDLDKRIKVECSCKSGKNGFFKQFKAIRKKMKENPDGVFISFLNKQNITTVLAGIGLKCKVIVSQRSDPKFAFGRDNPFSGLLRQFSKLIFVMADSAVFQTQDAMDYYPNMGKKKYQIIMNPLSDNILDRHIGERTKRIVAVSRLNIFKNLILAIDAFKEFSETHPGYVFEIYGKGEQEEELRRHAEALGVSDKVIFKGFCNNVHERILDAQMYIITSDFEGMSNSMIEALALGIPTIATDCPIGGARMVIEDGVNGFLVPVKDKEKLVEAMIKLAGDKELQEQVSIEGSKIREKLSVEEISRQWLELFN